MLKAIIRKTPLYKPACRLLDLWLEWQSIRAWRRADCPPPAPARIKHRILKSYTRRYRLKIMIETGTYKGDTVAAMQKRFDQIYSIELSSTLHKEAQDRFVGDDRIHLICGDSAKELPRLLENTEITTKPVLFWLDGHYSAGVTAKSDKETPICEELQAIFKVLTQPAVILIDDARCFGTAPDYPDIATLKALVHKYRPSADIEVDTDIIRIIVQ